MRIEQIWLVHIAGIQKGTGSFEIDESWQERNAESRTGYLTLMALAAIQ
jgi:hypothetical protein